MEYLGRKNSKVVEPVSGGGEGLLGGGSSKESSGGFDYKELLNEELVDKQLMTNMVERQEETVDAMVEQPLGGLEVVGGKGDAKVPAVGHNNNSCKESEGVEAVPKSPMVGKTVVESLVLATSPG